MKKLYILALLFICVQSLNAQYVSKLVTFDDYFMPDTNDYTMWFNGGMGYTYQMPVGPLTGYVIPPDSNLWGNGNPTYCFKYKATAWDSCVTSIDFLYDSTTVSATGYDRAVSLWLNPSADWNHYLYAAVTHNKKLEMSSYSWNNAGTSPVLPLLHNHWYRLRLSAQFIPGFSGWMFTTNAQVFDVTTGSPVQIGSDAGGANDEILPTDTAISISFSGAKYGGATKLDNFSFYGVVSGDSCETGIPCEPPALATATTNPLCNGGSGNVDLTVNGGTAPYTFSWSNGITAEDLVGVPSGDYMVTVTDASACISIVNAFVSQPTPVIILWNSTPDDPSTIDCDGAVSATVTGGTAPYTYLWSNGITTDANPDLCQGWFVGTVTDANGCSGSDSIYVDLALSVNGVDINNYSLYPNPASDLVTLTTANASSIKIYSLDGKLLKVVESRGTKSNVNVSDLSSALYIVEIETNGKKYFSKLSIQR